MEELCGTVERIVYTSPDGTFCVLRMREKDSGKQVTVTGSTGVLDTAPPFWCTV